MPIRDGGVTRSADRRPGHDGMAIGRPRAARAAGGARRSGFTQREEIPRETESSLWRVDAPQGSRGLRWSYLRKGCWVGVIDSRSIGAAYF